MENISNTTDGGMKGQLWNNKLDQYDVGFGKKFLCSAEHDY